MAVERLRSRQSAAVRHSFRAADIHTDFAHAQPRLAATLVPTFQIPQHREVRAYMSLRDMRSRRHSKRGPNADFGAKTSD